MNTLEFSPRCPPPLEGGIGWPENWLSDLCWRAWNRDWFSVAWLLANLYRFIYGKT
jgi:hypothetical protein